MRVLKWLLPFAVLGISAAVAIVLISTKPEAERRPAPPTVLSVEAIRVTQQDYPVIIKTRGTVRPRTQSTLIPEVSGRIVEVARNFREGGFFEKDEVLLQIDPRDYEITITVAESALASARLSLTEEKARAKQAERDWKRLGEGGKPSSLVLRKPQLAGAGAAVASSRAQLERARLDLERTRITAPYAGRMLEQNVDVGQYVSPGTVLARVYAVDYVEIRLPLTDRQLQFVDVPEQYRGEDDAGDVNGPPVTLKARAGRREHQWQGTLVRAEGSIDTQSRQLFVIAQVVDPYGKGPEGSPPLKVGQFVEAEIEGTVLRDVFVIPRSSLRGGNEVVIIDDEQKLSRHEVDVIWSDSAHAVVADKFEPGQLIAVSPLAFAVSGTKVEVRIAGENAAPAAAKQDQTNTAGDG